MEAQMKYYKKKNPIHVLDEDASIIYTFKHRFAATIGLEISHRTLSAYIVSGDLFLTDASILGCSKRFKL